MNTTVNCKPVVNQHLSNTDDQKITMVVKWKGLGKKQILPVYICVVLYQNFLTETEKILE
jgi:hypothetical protein